MKAGTKMNDTLKQSTCERGNDLVSFLYGEANEQEARDFKSHLQLCRECRSEIASLGYVRESIGLWKTEALSGFPTSQLVVKPREKSALAALREFFALSPLWMKGAVTFASILFCLMLVLLLARSQKQPQPAVVAHENTFTQTQVDQIVEKALRDKATELTAAAGTDEPSRVSKEPQVRPAKKKSDRSIQQAKVRRPLTKSEREQLAADLRLLSTRDEDSLNLLGDRINQEF